MEHVTACYWQKETVPNIFLSLQQRKYRRRKASVVYACISDNRELLMNLQNKIEEELQGRDIWKSYTEERIREKWSKQLAAVDKNSNYAGVLCVDSRVLLFDHGRMNLCGFFKRFGRTGWKVWKDQCMVGEVEAGTAILLTDHGFLNYCEEELAGCLKAWGAIYCRTERSGQRDGWQSWVGRQSSGAEDIWERYGFCR